MYLIQGSLKAFLHSLTIYLAYDNEKPYLELNVLITLG